MIAIGLVSVLALAGATEAGVLVDWKFDNLTQGVNTTDGSRLVDSSGNQRDAIAHGTMSVVTGPAAYGSTPAVVFADATGNYGEFIPGWVFGDAGPDAGSSFDFDAATSFTVETIAQFTNDGAAHVVVGRSQTATDTDWWLRKGASGAGDAAEGLTIVNGTDVGYVGGGTGLNGWHHIAMVRDRGDSTLKLYVDGVFDGSGADATGDLTNSAWSVLIGQFRDGGGPFNGPIDRIRISDAALLPSQFIQQVPEPSSAMLLSMGLTGLLAHARRRRRSSAGQR